MSKNIQQEDLEPKVVAPTSEETQIVEEDPLKVELERVQRTGKTEAEKAAFSLKKNADRAKELGVDVDEVLGRKQVDDIDDEDNKPVTIGMLKKIQQDNASKSALQLADEIGNESERELTKFHLQNSIRSTGNPTEDIRLARALVNAAKNSQVIEEMIRKTDARTHSNSSSVNTLKEETPLELSPQEKQFLGKPFNMTQVQIIAARKK